MKTPKHITGNAISDVLLLQSPIIYKSEITT
jgi:hypothetical protein